MLHGTIVLDNVILIAAPAEKEFHWDLTLADTNTPTTFKVTTTNLQFGAITALAIKLHEEKETPKEVVDFLYKAIGDVLMDCPIDCYPF